MQVSQISSLNDLIDEVASIVESGKFWWRGVKDAKHHKLVPGIFRENRDREQETNKVRLFQEMAPARHDKCPSNDPGNKEAGISWIFLMQHYGLQTRLLDWTRSPLIATFFAVSNYTEVEKESDSILWGLSPKNLNREFFPESSVDEFLPNSELIKNVYHGAFTGEPGRHSYDKRVAAILPKQIDIRMLLQMSRFTIHGNPTPLEDFPDLNNYLYKIIIPEGKKDEIATQLAYMGIVDSNLFPDLDHLASDLNKNIFEAF